MNWFKSVGLALAEKFNINFTENTTEAELVDMVEQLKGIESLQAENVSLNEKVDVLEALHTENEAKLAQVIERANNNATQLQEIQAKVTALTVNVSAIQGKPLQTGHETGQAAFTRSEQVADSAIKKFRITLNQ
jgi:cell shape-determining protein MreC